MARSPSELSLPAEPLSPLRPRPVAAPADAPALVRVVPRAKFLFAGSEKLYLRGVTYGTFRPDEHGDELPRQDTVESDFAAMAANGFNAVRMYAAPPPRVLDAALRHGLRVMVGLAAERTVGYLNDRRGAVLVEDDVREGVRKCAGHPAVLCYAIGNEIPSSVVRWLGPRRIERLLARLARAVRDEDPEALVTYANYPSTEYLRVPDADLVAFNVFLEDPTALASYVGRLQNIAGDRPLVLTELGLDSLRHGEAAQAASVAAQVRTAFAEGCAGAFVYSWTDEWHRGGEDVLDWRFGLTGRDREPKPALHAARRAFVDSPFRWGLGWPRISVIVCTRNGAATLRECLDGLMALDYPDSQLIVVDDGSTDATRAIASEFPVRVLSAGGHGLGHARNVGLEASTGEIVAYIDDDAWPDPDWLRYLAAEFLTTDHAAVGGPNVAPPDAPAVARCVDQAPGIPTHVLISDRIAEHIPGCNMAFRRDRLEAIGGFDPQFTTAGDDVDVCWRIQERGWTLGFSPGATVVHRRRDSIRAYARQQRSYGRAEALLERKWPGKYNGSGHISWHGRLYRSAAGGNGRRRIYFGTWGEAPFQRMYTRAPSFAHALLGSPQSYLVVGALVALAALGALWEPMEVVAPIAAIGLFTLAGHAAASSIAAVSAETQPSRTARLRFRAITALLHIVGPAARLAGQLLGGLTPWRRRGSSAVVPWPRRSATWTEHRVEPAVRLRRVEDSARLGGNATRRGAEYDRWDLEIRAGVGGAARLRMGVEEHGGGAQLVRFRCWPKWSPGALVSSLLLALLGLLAGRDDAWAAAGVLAAAAVLVFGGAVWQTATSCAVALDSIADSLLETDQA
jgi:GT2 family glycosyltransferase